MNLVPLTVPLLWMTLGMLHPADPGLRDAYRAEALLGPAFWTRVIRIENASRCSRYPPIVHALIFELKDVLWIYIDADGTQSLSEYERHAEADKHNLGPLLRRKEPGFMAWEDAPRLPGKDAEAGPLPNGCFIDSLALLRQRVAAGKPAMMPRLLSYYVRLPDGLVRGHTVLQFWTKRGCAVIDPLSPKRTREMRSSPADAPLAQARLIRPDAASARVLSLDGAMEAMASAARPWMAKLVPVAGRA